MPLQIGTESNVIQDRGRWFVAPQAVGGTIVYPVGAAPTDTTGGPLRTLGGSSIDHAQQREKHGFTKQGTREFIGSLYTSMRDTPWKIEARLTPPSNFTAIVPELHHLLTALLGSRTINAGTSYVYEAADIDRHDLLSLARLYNEQDEIFAEWLGDCVVSKGVFKWAGGSPPTWEFEGKAATYIAAGYTTLDGDVTTSTTIVIADGDAINVGARITIGTDDNGGAGYLVTDRTDATTFVLDQSLSAADGATVRPFMPAPTYSTEPPIGAISGAVTLGGAQLPLTSLEFTIDNQTTFSEDEIATEAFADGIPGDQDLMGQFTVRATESQVADLVARQQFGTAALELACGDGAAGRNHTLSWPQIEMWVSNVQAAPVGTIAVDFRALDSVDGAGDAFTYTVA